MLQGKDIEAVKAHLMLDFPEGQNCKAYAARSTLNVAIKVKAESTKPTQTLPTYLPAWPIGRKSRHSSVLFRSPES